MNRIFVTADTHGTHDILKLSENSFPQQKELTRDDFLIISGDFGGVFYGKEYLNKFLKENPWLENSPHKEFIDRDNYVLSLHQNKPYTTLFIDGNHENFDELNSYPIEEWNGGKVHFIRPNVIHLMRGEVYTINGKKIFVMGGADSIDKCRRKKGVSWWSEEMPTYQECMYALSKLDEHNWEVDYVITHSAPDNILYRINPTFQHNFITNFLFTIDKDLKFKHWYFGHYHIDKQIDEKHTCLYNTIIELN